MGHYIDTQEAVNKANPVVREFVNDQKVLQVQNLLATDRSGHPTLLIDLVEDVTQKRVEEALFAVLNVWNFTHVILTLKTTYFWCHN